MASAQPTRVRGGLVLAAICLVVAGVAFTFPRIQATDASWTNAEFASGSITAETIPAATISQCRFQGTSVVPVILTPYFEITWHFAPGSGYVVPQNVTVARSAQSGLGGLLTPIVGGDGLRTTGPDTNGIYTTQVETGLLGNLLGGSFNLAIIAKVDYGESTWSAVPARVNAKTGLAGLTGNCSVP